MNAAGNSVEKTKPDRPPGHRAQAARDTGWGLLFLAPNLLGFLAFTLIPLVYSLVLAFSNWDLRLHNPFKPENQIHFVGLANFHRLLGEPNFWKYFGNTLFLMMGIPVGIAASLVAALLLSNDLRGRRQFTWAALIASTVFAGSIALFAAYHNGDRGMSFVLLALATLILIGGAIGGQSVYRTLFYLPNFTAGVATMLLWKKLFQPSGGVINNLLAWPLHHLTAFLRAQPPWQIRCGSWIGLVLFVGLFGCALRRLQRLWSESEIGSGSMLVGVAFLLLPIVLAPRWLGVMPGSSIGLAGVALLLIGWRGLHAGRGREMAAPRPMEGIGTALMLSILSMIGLWVLIGLSLAIWNLPAGAATKEGLTPPEWLQSAAWVKPALMLMGLWAAIGSGTMLLYIAALTNVPQELYEAADIDGATRFTKFWNVTWPQLAPTTFFVVVMSMIGGLQGGFDQAKVMTSGGPGGASTTLAFMIYQEGFETGRLGYSSSAAWTLFLLVLIVTAFNWKFGNKFVND